MSATHPLLIKLETGVKEMFSMGNVRNICKSQATNARWPASEISDKRLSAYISENVDDYELAQLFKDSDNREILWDSIIHGLKTGDMKYIGLAMVDMVRECYSTDVYSQIMEERREDQSDNQ